MLILHNEYMVSSACNVPSVGCTCTCYRRNYCKNIGANPTNTTGSLCAHQLSCTDIIMNPTVNKHSCNYTEGHTRLSGHFDYVHVPQLEQNFLHSSLLVPEGGMGRDATVAIRVFYTYLILQCLKAGMFLLAARKHCQTCDANQDN